MAHAAPSSDSPSRGRHAAGQDEQNDRSRQQSAVTGSRSSEQGPTGPSGVPQRVHLEERTNAENAIGWLTALVGLAGIGVVVAIIVLLVIGVVQRG